MEHQRVNPRHVGGGGILRNSSGALIFAFGSYYGHKSSLWVETQVALDGLLYVKRKQLPRFGLNCVPCCLFLCCQENVTSHGMSVMFLEL